LQLNICVRFTKLRNYLLSSVTVCAGEVMDPFILPPLAIQVYVRDNMSLLVLLSMYWMMLLVLVFCISLPFFSRKICGLGFAASRSHVTNIGIPTCSSSLVLVVNVNLVGGSIQRNDYYIHVYLWFMILYFSVPHFWHCLSTHKSVSFKLIFVNIYSKYYITL
jgi:hypothetical protein